MAAFWTRRKALTPRLGRRAEAAGAWPDLAERELGERVPHSPRLELVLLGLALLAIYGSLATGLLAECWSDPNYSYGVFVPAIVLALALQRRHDVVLPGSLEARRPLRLAWALLGLGACLFVLGAAAAELFTLRVSGVLVLLGLCGVLGGPGALRRYGLCLALLLAMIPMPYSLYYGMSFPLQLLSTQLATGGLHLLGLDVTRTGNIFVVHGIALEVVRACSGVRSMMALCTLAAAAAIALRMPARRAVALVLLAAPVAMLGNALRLLCTALLVVRVGRGATEGSLHESVGLATFLVALAMLGGLAALLHPGARARPGRTNAARVGSHAGRASWPSRIWLWLPTPWPVSSRSAWSALAVLLMAGGYGTFLRSHTARAGSLPQLSAVPRQIDAYAAVDIPLDSHVTDEVQADAYLFRNYLADAAPNIGLYVGYYANQRERAQIHSPLHCYPGAGFRIHDSETLPVRGFDGRVSDLRRLVIERDRTREVVLYWYDTRTGRLASDARLKLNLMRTALLHQPQDAALVRWSTPIGEGEDVEAATTRLLTTAAHALPSLNAILPFAHG